MCWLRNHRGWVIYLYCYIVICDLETFTSLLEFQWNSMQNILPILDPLIHPICTEWVHYFCQANCVTDNGTFRADSRFAPSQWETTLLCSNISHWLGASLESTLTLHVCISLCDLVNLNPSFLPWGPWVGFLKAQDGQNLKLSIVPWSQNLRSYGKCGSNFISILYFSNSLYWLIIYQSESLLTFRFQNGTAITKIISTSFKWKQLNVESISISHCSVNCHWYLIKVI